MKTRILFSLMASLLVVLALNSSCDDPVNPPPGGGDPPDPPIVTVDSLGTSISEITFTSGKDACLIVVQTNTNWTASENADWLSLSARSGSKNTGFLIGATKNTTFKREATVTINTGDKSKAIKVTQAGASLIPVQVKEVALNLVLVEGGNFTMGSNEQSYFGVAHQVALSDFYITETEVTNAVWKAVRGTLPYTDHDENGLPDLPVSETTWDGITADFLPALNQLTGKTFKLPTEAQWEYAALGGKKSNSYNYAGSNTLEDVGWDYHNSGRQKNPVGLKEPNELGIYDMSGNVTEWCRDWYHPYYGFTVDNNVLSVPDLQTDPTGPATGTQKVVRGGDFMATDYWGSSRCHVKYRDSIHPSGYDTASSYNPYTFYSINTGFRLVLTP